MLNLTFNIFWMIICLVVLICLWLILPEGVKLRVQAFVYSLWAKCACEWKRLGERNAKVKEEHRYKTGGTHKE